MYPHYNDLYRALGGFNRRLRFDEKVALSSPTHGNTPCFLNVDGKNMGPTKRKVKKYQPSGEGGTRSPPAMSQNPKWPPGGPKMAERSGEEKTDGNSVHYVIASSRPPQH